MGEEGSLFPVECRHRF